MDAVAALRAGRLVVLPTDTVYGLAAAADDEAAVRELSQVKGRAESTPIALVAASVDVLLDLVPELRDNESTARELLPGPYTLVFPNPAGRYPWLSPETIGVRVPELSGDVKAILMEVEAVAATSAAQAERISSGTSASVRGSGPPWRFAHVAATASTSMRIAFTSPESSGTRTPIVSGDNHG